MSTELCRRPTRLTNSCSQCPQLALPRPPWKSRGAYLTVDPSLEAHLALWTSTVTADLTSTTFLAGGTRSLTGNILRGHHYIFGMDQELYTVKARSLLQWWNALLENGQVLPAAIRLADRGLLHMEIKCKLSDARRSCACNGLG